ncbi:MAG TPA: hypothetical protein VN026_03225 [Bacteroidia bacterium]|jgi:hypothetical protein|nr:hypothetical protein [Bacteroidia bacterium]
MEKSEKYKTSLLFGILFFLSLPLLQNIFHFKKNIKPLNGDYYQANDTLLTLQSWLNGRYQIKKEEMINAYFGFHNYFIRLHNQIDFELFRKSNTDRILVGKQDFLFETSYIESYFGRNFVGKEKLEEKFQKLKSIQDYLATQNIFLEVVFAPGKASYYPEFIPDNWQSKKKLSNYEYCRSLCKKLNITFIDFNAWFLQKKNILKCALYPKTGFHWSNYGAFLAADSLSKHIEKMTGLNLGDIILDSITVSHSLKKPDEDISEAMNLFLKVPALTMPYANYSYHYNGQSVKPKALFIGDSYFWNLDYQGLTNNLFTDCKFWYYNHAVFPESEKVREVKKLNLAEEIKKQRIIVLMATENNIQNIGWGFIEQAFDLYKEDLN